MVKTFDLIPTHAPTQSRRQYLKLKSDIRRNGIREAIKYVVFEGDKYVVDGHHRLQAARELGLREVTAQEVELPFGGYRSIADLTNTDER